MEERERRAQHLDLHEPVKLLFTLDPCLQLSMTTLGQYEVDETDFNQIGAKSTNLGIWIFSII